MRSVNGSGPLRGLIISLLSLLPATLALADAMPDYDQIARNIVRDSLAVQPGEVIVISGGPEQTDLMAALQVAVGHAGGQSILQLNIPEANKRVLVETPLEHLRRLPTAQLMLMRTVDGFINVASTPDPDLMADVPEERLDAVREAAAPLNDVFRNADFRSVTLGQTGGIPTEEYAALQGADYEALSANFWQALAVGADELSAAGRIVTANLTPGTRTTVTTEAGTDLSFTIAEHGARINAGRTLDKTGVGPATVWLPAGEAYTCIERESVHGTLVVPHTVFRGLPIENLRMEFEAGRLTSMSADRNEAILREFLDASSADTAAVSVLDIGLNPSSSPPEGSRHHSWEMGGMVTLSLGNNIWAGGDNAAEGGFSVHLPGATVAVADELLVSNGELSQEIRAAYRD